MSPNTTETSVTISLAELGRIERERLREEEARRARLQADRARAAHQEEAERRVAAQARIAAEAESQARHRREEAEAKARAAAREHAQAEVARFEVEARAKLDIENAARAHELAALRVRAEASNRHLAVALASALGILACVGATALYSQSLELARVTIQADGLREALAAGRAEHQRALRTTLLALDRRLSSHPSSAGTDDIWAGAIAARSSIVDTNLDHAKVQAFAEAIDAAEARRGSRARLVALGQREADLTAWASHDPKTDLSDLHRAAAGAKATAGDEPSIRTYEAALNQLRDRLAAPGATPTPRRPPTGSAPPPGTCEPGNPLCGLDGRPL